MLRHARGSSGRWLTWNRPDLAGRDGAVERVQNYLLDVVESIALSSFGMCLDQGTSPDSAQDNAADTAYYLGLPREEINGASRLVSWLVTVAEYTHPESVLWPGPVPPEDEDAGARMCTPRIR